MENTGRSQMAEGFFNRKYASKGHRGISAGTRPASQIKPLAVQAMMHIFAKVNAIAWFFFFIISPVRRVLALSFAVLCGHQSVFV
jgi:hypothetical protein